MKFRRYILFFILILTFENAFASSVLVVVKDFGNVKVRIITEVIEERQKVFLFGQLAEELAKQLNYSKPIFLNFERNFEFGYFISYDKGNIQYSRESTAKNFLNDSAIVIRQFARQFDAQTTLKLLEYAILNIENIKSSQTPIEYKRNKWIINSIDTTLIKQILNKPNSILVNNVLNLKFKRYEESNFGISYYLQNNKYTVFTKHHIKDTTFIITTFDDIYALTKIDNHSMVVFDTDSSFYFIDKSITLTYYEDGSYYFQDENEKTVSERHIIQNLNGYYAPFEVKYIGGNKLAIYSRLQIREQERTLIYLIDEDKLIDIDELIHTK